MPATFCDVFDIVVVGMAGFDVACDIHSARRRCAPGHALVPLEGQTKLDAISATCIDIDCSEMPFCMAKTAMTFPCSAYIASLACKMHFVLR